MPSRLTTRLRRLRAHPATARGAWGIADQALSSLSNFALGLLVVRNVTTSEFGLYSLLFVTYLLILGTARALFGQPFTIRVDNDAEAMERDRGAVVGGALTLSLFGALAIVGVSSTLRGTSASALTAFALTLPGLITQDAYRLTFFALQRPRLAAINDLVWTIVMFVAAGAVIASGRASVASLILCWGGGATVGAVIGWIQCRTRPHPSRAVAYVRRQRDLSYPFLGDFWAQQGALQLNTYGLGLVASVATVGIFRTAALLMGPLNLLTNALAVVAMPELVRLRHRSVRWFRAAVVGLSSVPFAAALVVGAVLSSLPDAWGVSIVGPTWRQLDGVIVPFALARAAGGATWGAIMGCRALEAAAGMLRTRLITAPITVAATLVGASVDGARGAAIGMAAATVFAALLWWLQYRSAERGWRAAAGSPTATTDGSRTTMAGSAHHSGR